MSIVRYLLFVSFFLCLSIDPGFGQFPNYQQFQVKDGLPSAEVYDLLIDKNGDVWLTTDRGVARYNGNEFETFTKADGLTDNTNFIVYEDWKGRIWFLAFDGSICYYENGEFHPHPLNEQLSAYDLVWWEGIEVSPDNSIRLYERKAVGPLLNQYAEINSTWDKLQMKEHIRLPEYVDSKIQIHANAELIKSKISKSWVLVSHETAFNKISTRYSLNPLNYRDSLTILQVSGMGINLPSLHKNRILVLSKNKLIADYVVDQYIYQTIVENDRIIVCTGNGLMIYGLNPPHNLIATYFENIGISAIEKDREGNYWVASLDKGLLCLPNLDVFSINKTNKGENIIQVYELKTFNNHLIIGTAANILSLDKELNCNTLISPLSFIPYHIPYLKDKLVLQNFYLEKKGSNEIKLKRRNWNTKKDWNVHSDLIFQRDTLFWTNDNSLFKALYPFRGNPKYHYLEHHNLPGKILSFDQLNPSTTLVSTLKGIYKFHWQKESQLEKIDLGENFSNPRIKKVIALDGQSFVFSTLEEGLGFVYDDKIFKYTRANGLASDIINNLYLENENTLWLCTNSGLDRLIFKFDKHGLNIENIQNFSTYEGLISNYINEVIRWEDNIFVGTDQGISYFNPQSIKAIHPPPLLRIDDVLVNGQIIDKNSTAEFAYNESDLEIRFTANGMKRPKNESLYHYRLITGNNDSQLWSTTNNREIRFSNLTSGNYLFEVKALNNSGSIFSNVDNYAFAISPHFSNTWWFYALLALLAFGLLLFLFYNRINRLKQQAAYERLQQENLLKINEAQLSALRSQMNPHFIFNSLNAIQNFIFKKDVRQANHFLAKFSRLVRKSLTLSKLDAIPLAEEISFLRDYIELEQMRFPATFDYEISLGEGIDPEEVIIPPLLIQPLLENSIRHGFKGLDRKGMITIAFAQVDNLLSIVLQDNGIGLLASKAVGPKSTSHKSFAIKIIQERILLINQRNKNEQATFEIKEIVNPDHQIGGVIAQINLPTSL